MNDDRYNRSKKRSEAEYDGVIYEPSDDAKRIARKDSGVVRKGYVPAKSPRKRKEPPRSQFALFYVATLFVGVIICIVIFAIVLGSFTKKDGSSGSAPTPSPEPSPTSLAVHVSELDKLTGVVSEAESIKNTFKVINMDNGNIRELIVQPNTVLRDQYGSELLYSDFKVGDVVEASYDKKNNKLETFGLSAAAWEKRLIKDVYVDAEKNTVTYGSEVRSYDYNTLIMLNKAQYDISGISPIDIITMRGMRDKVWYIEVVKSHGYLQIEGAEEIKDGIVEVDTGLYQKLSESTRLEVLEGPHKIIVRGANIDLFTKNITITQGQTEVLDLSEVVFKTGLLTVTANVSDYLLKIDGEETSPDEPISLGVGVHRISIDKGGYEHYERVITMTEAPQHIAAELVEIKPEATPTPVPTPTPSPTPEQSQTPQSSSGNEQNTKTSKVYITTEPDGAEIYIDNARVGISPVQVSVSYGQHTFVVRKTGYIDVGMNVNLTDPEHRYLIPLRLKPTAEADIGTGPMTTPTPNPNQPPVMP